jgi:tetratricopeptide (TPR) repeat protein
MKSHRHIAQNVLFFLAIAILSGCNRYEGGQAPSGNAEVRHQWGIKKLGDIYLKGIKWVKKSDIIQHDVGKIKGVTPIGNNPCICAFTDGCNCNLSLEVTGTRGIGHFEMVGAIVYVGSMRFDFEVGIWTFDDRKTDIHPTFVTVAAYYAPAHFIKVLNKEIRQTPNDRLLYFKRSHVRYALGDLHGALEDITHAIDLLYDQTKCAQSCRDKTQPLETKCCSSDEDLIAYRRTLALLKLEQGQVKEAYDLMQRIVESSRASYQQEYDVLLTWIVQRYSGESGELLLRHSIRPEIKEIDSFISAITEIFLGNKSPDSCDGLSKSKTFKFHLAHAHYFRGHLNAAKECTEAALALYPIYILNHDTLALHMLHETLALQILLNRIKSDRSNASD